MRYRSREWFQQRIKTLNEKHVTTASQMNAVLREMMDLATEDWRTQVAVVILNAVANVQRRTPVDTGRARAGWQIEAGASPSNDAPAEGLSRADYARIASDAVANAPDLTTADVVHIVNNVKYILILNAGWSKKHPAGFIDNMLDEIRRALEEIARSSRA